MRAARVAGAVSFLSMPMPRAGFLAFSQASSGAATGAMRSRGADSGSRVLGLLGSALLLVVRRERTLSCCAAMLTREFGTVSDALK